MQNGVPRANVTGKCKGRAMKARVLGWAQVRKCQAGQAWGAGRAGLLYVLVRQEQGHKVVQCGREKATMEWILETLRTPAPSTVRMGGGAWPGKSRRLALGKPVRTPRTTLPPGLIDLESCNPWTKYIEQLNKEAGRTSHRGVAVQRRVARQQRSSWGPGRFARNRVLSAGPGRISPA